VAVDQETLWYVTVKIDQETLWDVMIKPKTNLILYNRMKLIAKGSQIDITLCPINFQHMDNVISMMNIRFEKEENDPILGYIVNNLFYTLNFMDDVSVGSTDHYSLNFAKKYKDTCWVILNKHPNKLYNPMAYLTSCNIFNVEEYDIWTDERSNSLIAVVTELDCD